MPETLGTITKTLFLASESHKLHLEFTAGGTIYAGQPVKLAADGQIVAMGAADEEHLCIGISLHDAIEDEEATVATRGYMVLEAEAAEALDAGPVKWASYNAPTERNRYTDAGPVTNATCLGWSLTVAADAGDTIHFLMKN